GDRHGFPKHQISPGLRDWERKRRRGSPRARALSVRWGKLAVLALSRPSARAGAGLGVDALPHAAGGPEIPPARRRLALAFFEAITRECIHNVLRLGAPPALRFDPGHPALLAKLIEAVHGLHGVLPINRRGVEGRIGGYSCADPPL